MTQPTTGVGARITIQPPVTRPPVYSLMICAPSAPENGSPDDGWAAGFQFIPEACGATGSGRLVTDCLGATSAMTAAGRPAKVTGDPFAIYATDRCSAIGYQAADYIGRASRLLDAITSYHLAAELWDGSLVNGTTITNRALVDTASDELTAAAVSAVNAIGLIDQGISFYGKGQQGMIHMTPSVLAVAAAGYAIQKVGKLWMSPMGNIVVADAGYSGNGPTGKAAPTTTQWIYGTDIIETLVSPMSFLPDVDLIDDPGAFMAQALDRTLNTVVVYATRLASYKWDECVHVAAEVSVPVPATGGA